MTQQINLIDGGAQGGRDWLNGLVLLAVSATACAAVAAHYGYEYRAWQQLLAIPSAPDEAAADPVANDPLSLQLQLAEAELAGGERLQQAVSLLVDAPRNTAQRLASLVAAMPPSMWLKEVEFVGAQGLRISGAALRSEDLSAYSAKLSATPAFAGLPVHVLAVDHRAAKAAPMAAPQAAAADAEESLGESGVPDSIAYYIFELSSLEAANTGGGAQ